MSVGSFCLLFRSLHWWHLPHPVLSGCQLTVWSTQLISFQWWIAIAAAGCIWQVSSIAWLHVANLHCSYCLLKNEPEKRRFRKKEGGGPSHTSEIILGEKLEESFSPQLCSLVQVRARETWANTNELPNFEISPPHPFFLLLWGGWKSPWRKIMIIESLQ